MARSLTHSCAMPALRTADEMALTAVQSAFSSWVISPVPLAFLPSSMTKRVRVTISVSKGVLSVIAGVWCRCWLQVLAAGASRWGTQVVITAGGLKAAQCLQKLNELEYWGCL